MSCALLIAEPEPSTGSFLERHLAEDGFDVLRTEDGDDALALAERARPDLVLVGSELDVVRRLREGEPGRSWNRDVPVIVLGPEEADAVDRVRAFDRGADDFLARPFMYDELLARIRAVLRRVTPPVGTVLEAGELVIDRSTRCATVGGQILPLSAKQFDLLAKLGSEPTRVWRHLWCYPFRLTGTEKRRRVETPPSRSSPDLRARTKIARICCLGLAGKPASVWKPSVA